MQALPLPIFTFVLSAVACAMLWRLEVGNWLARALFTMVFALIAMGTLLTGLRFGYGMENMAAIQRVIPLFVGPLIYLGFRTYTCTAQALRVPIIAHLALWAVVALIPQLLPSVRGLYDVAIGASYVIYAVLIFVIWRRGPDALRFAPLQLTRGLRIWMLVASGMLLLMLAFDTAIAVSFATGQADTALTLISVGSVISGISLIAAIVAFSARPAPVPAPQAATSEGAQIEQAARTLLTNTKLYLDTDLTLDRLARRLTLPTRTVSEAINQTQGLNVSQYVNGFRLEHAARLLRDTNDPVTKVMEQSGFLTRSNFYREFERVYAQSPTAYRKAQS